MWKHPYHFNTIQRTFPKRSHTPPNDVSGEPAAQARRAWLRFPSAPLSLDWLGLCGHCAAPLFQFWGSMSPSLLFNWLCLGFRRPPICPSRRTRLNLHPARVQISLATDIFTALSVRFAASLVSRGLAVAFAPYQTANLATHDWAVQTQPGLGIGVRYYTLISLLSRVLLPCCLPVHSVSLHFVSAVFIDDEQQRWRHQYRRRSS